MKNLNLETTQIFISLIERLHHADHIKIENDPYMPLTIEKLGTVTTSTGNGILYSICHYYEQNGDLMQDPEMCFIAIDQRKNPQAWAEYYVFPYYFCQANIGFDEASIVIEYEKIVNVEQAMQAEHTAFANQWLINIQAQGFLNVQP